MPRNNRVARETKSYKLRLDPDKYDIIQKAAADNGVPMNTLLQAIVAEYTQRLTETEQSLFDKIKSLPLEERKAIIKKLSGGNE